MTTSPELDNIKNELAALHDKSTLKDSEVSALMSIVIQTNKDVSTNLIKLTEVVSALANLEKTQEEQQENLTRMSEKVSKNETDIKLSLQDSKHIKDTLDEIKEGQKGVFAWAAKIFGTIITVAIVGGLVYAKT